MLFSLRKNGLTSLFMEVGVFKETGDFGAIHRRLLARKILHNEVAKSSGRFHTSFAEGRGQEKSTPRQIQRPCPFFLGLFENTKENHKNTKELSDLEKPKKPWKMIRKHPKRPRNSPARKYQGNKNTKGKNHRVGAPNWTQTLISQTFGVATPAEPRGEKKPFLVQILGGEKLFKFVEKCRWNIFKRPERG